MRAALALIALAVVACKPGPVAAPTTAAPTETAIPAAAVTLCEHGVPAELCTQCEPDLAPVFQAMGDWCPEHGVPESQCLKCHPGLTFAATELKDWCPEHGLPESKCTKCHPNLVAKYIEAGDYCREHGFPESVCPLCHPELGEAVIPPPDMRVRLASSETVNEAGIRTERVSKGRIGRTLEVVGTLSFDRNRLAELSARQDASILQVRADVGDEVKAGEALVTLAAAQVGASRGQLRAASARVEAARAALDREEKLVANGISPKAVLDAARAELAAAQGALDAATSALAATGARPGSASGDYALSSPFPGTVVKRQAAAGRTAAAGQVLLAVADLTTMWAELDLPEADAGDVRPGQPVSVTLEGARHEPIAATIARVDPSVDPHSRTVRARVVLPNPERRLKGGTFLRASILIEPQRDALLVPRLAVQKAEGQRIVFVKTGDAQYQPVAVKLGATSGDEVEVLAGLQGGEELVTTGAFLLKTEILKDSIGAGCCDTGGD